MSFFSKLIPKKENQPYPSLQFGRYSDGYKTSEQLLFWDNALKHYHNEKFLTSFENLLAYLKEAHQENVEWTQSSGLLTFTIYQGSKIITGEATAIHMQVRAGITGFEKTDPGWMRVLLEENYSMTYSRFAINQNNEIVIYFDNYMEEAAPHKMYEALRELAIRADKMDDILLSEFNHLKPIENKHIIPLSKEVIQAKTNFVLKKLALVNAIIQDPTDEVIRCKGSLVFMILACGYSLDYLVKPEGALMKNIENWHKIYFNDQAETVEIKTRMLIRHFKEVFDISEVELHKEMYDIRSTFGQDLPVGINGLWEVLDAQWNDLEWYIQNEYLLVFRAICDYSVGFSLFSMSLPESYKKLLHLYYMVTESEYFGSLGYPEMYSQNQTLKKKEIQKKIQTIIVESLQSDYPIKADTSLLRYESMEHFIFSYLLMIKNAITQSS